MRSRESMIWTENKSSFFFTPEIGGPSVGVSVTGSNPAPMASMPPRIRFTMVSRDRAEPTRDRSGPRRPPSPFTR